MQRRILKEWNCYKSAVYPNGMTEDQERQLQKAFYAGSAAMYYLQMRLLSEGPNVTDDDLSFMVDLDKELNEFAAKDRG